MAQTFFSNVQEKKENKNELTLLNWNIQNPSKERAVKISKYLIENPAQIMILTEAKKSKGCEHIIDRLKHESYSTFYNLHEKDYGVIIATLDKNFEQESLQIEMNSRAILITGNSKIGKLNIFGTYVPSHGSIDRRDEDKRKFQSELTQIFPKLIEQKNNQHLIVTGDFNVLERNHIPNYSSFGEWEYEFYESFLKNGLKDAFRLLNGQVSEYSWFGRNGNGYRYDHTFISDSLKPHLKECKYLHQPRLQNLSDHSMMLLKLSK